MEIKEKIRKVYQKGGIQVDDDYIEYKMKDKKTVEQFKWLYKQEEVESMNYILGKPLENTIFTKGEIKMCSKIDLFNRKTVEMYKKIYERETKEGASKCI